MLQSLIAAGANLIWCAGDLMLFMKVCQMALIVSQHYMNVQSNVAILDVHA